MSISNLFIGIRSTRVAFFRSTTKRHTKQMIKKLMENSTALGKSNMLPINDPVKDMFERAGLYIFKNGPYKLPPDQLLYICS